MSDNLPATIDPSLMVGLEDFDVSTDAIMPTIKIDHDEGKFLDSLSGEMFDSLNVVILGLVKQRIMWEADPSDNPPLCRSLDFKVGMPGEKFPWKDSGFDRPAETEGVTLPCETCQFQQWGSHPKNDTPWCSEQHTFAILMPVGENGWAPALFTVQRTGIKPSRAYLTSFARAKTPTFTVHTVMTVDHRKKGTRPYGVPIFTKGEATDQDDWPEFAQQYANIRSFIQQPRNLDRESSEETPVATPTTKGDVVEAKEAPATAAPAADADDDDVPF